MGPRVVVSALLAAFVVLVAAAPAPAASWRSCGKISIGFTSAKISADAMPCSAARDLFHAWRKAVRKAAPDGGPPPSPLPVGLFSCRLGGSDLTVKLDCTGADGTQKMKGRWGG